MAMEGVDWNNLDQRPSLSCYLAIALLVRHVTLRGPSTARCPRLKRKRRGGEGEGKGKGSKYIQDCVFDFCNKWQRGGLWKPSLCSGAPTLIEEGRILMVIKRPDDDNAQPQRSS